MTRLHMVLLILICIGANVLQSGAETLLATEGDLVTLRCSLTGTYTYPEWRGPPNLVKYTVQDDPPINTGVTASARLSYASNKQDLLLDNAVVADSGEYKCSYAGIGENPFNLTVSVKTSADCGCESLNNCNISKGGCIGLWFLIGIGILCGITLIVVPIAHFGFGVKLPFGDHRQERPGSARK